MKLNKIFMLGLLATATLFTACSDDKEYQWGSPAGNYNVTFANQENQTLELTATSFDVTLSRPVANASEAITVPIEVLNAPSFMTVPASVNFAAGQSTATLTVNVGEGMEPFVDYVVSLRVAESYANPYVQQDNFSQFKITVLKEDYADYGVMTYYSWLFEQSWGVTVQYSDMMDLYRADIFADGYPFYFAIDEKGVLRITDKNGKNQKDTPTGYSDSTYGPVTYRWLSDNYTGISNGKYYVPVQYRVSAGSFGSDYDNFSLAKY